MVDVFSENSMGNADDEMLSEANSSTEVSKCPACGANLRYDPATLKLVCDHCGSKAAIDFGNFAEEQSFSRLLNEGQGNAVWNETRVFNCNNCGAKEILAKKEISRKCAFCGTDNVVETDDIPGLKPNGILPFLITKEQATDRIVQWAKKRIFAPSKFKKNVHPDALAGNYVPAFTFDSTTYSRYEARLGEYYYTSRKVNGKTVTTRHTRWFTVRGNYSRTFDDILIYASDIVGGKQKKNLLPYFTNNSQKYSSDFLFGFSASQYSKNGEECWAEAKSVMADTLRREILAKHKYDTVDYCRVYTDHHNISYKYLMLPVYVGHCNYSKKNYNVFVNGQNGKVAGKAPKSIIRVGLAVLLGIAAIAGAIVGITLALL